MSHGTPDWGLVGPKATTYGLDDLGEHAVRLGSPHLWDRRGDTIWLTDFRNGMGDTVRTDLPGDGDVRLFAGFARQGAFCVRLMANAGRTVGLEKVFPYPAGSRLGLEFSFSIEANSDYIIGEMYVDNTVNELMGFVRYDVGNDELQYMQEPVGPTWPVIADNLNLWAIERCPNTLKLVIDPSATPPEFVRVILNDVTYSLAGIPLWPAAPTGVAYASFRIRHTADGAADAAISIDNIIVTQNEP